MNGKNNVPAIKESSGDTPPDDSPAINDDEKSELLSPGPDELSTENNETSYPAWPEVEKNITTILELIEGRLKYDKTKEDAFNRLYGELDELKKNKAFEDIRPLYIDLILLYDRINQSNNDNECKICELLDSIKEELIEILSRRNIELIPQNNEPFFDPTLQRIVNTIKVENVDLNGKVISVLRDGFTYKGCVLRPQEVVVGKYLSS